MRHDLAEVPRTTIEELGSPGTWWTGEERVAIAAEARRAAASDLPPWETPSATPGLIDEHHPLPDAAVDAAWRLARHPGTLTEDWYESTVDALPSPEHYVELVGIVAMVTAVDRFCLGLGLDPFPLPDPQPGEPTRREVDGAGRFVHWVPTIGGGGPHVAESLTAVPAVAEAQRRLSDTLYLPIEQLLDVTWSRGPLDRVQVELIAARTSQKNDCFY